MNQPIAAKVRQKVRGMMKQICCYRSYLVFATSQGCGRSFTLIELLAGGDRDYRYLGGNLVPRVQPSAGKSAAGTLS